MVTGIVLAGGKSSRMGFDKCFLEYKNITFVERALKLLSNISDKIILSSNNHLFEKFKAEIVSDLFKDIGPISGIYSSLLKSKTETNILIPCDLPYLTTELLNFLLNKSADFDAVVPVFNQKAEPLVGVYKKSLLPKIEEKIIQKQYKILSLLENSKTLFFPIHKNLDFYSENLFDNINTIEDFEQLK